MPKIVDEERILNAAGDLLMVVGYSGATTRAIADAAGVNEVTLFRRYGSKAALFVRAIEHRLAETPLNRVSYTGNLESDLIALAEAYIETNEAFGDIVAIILIELPRSPELHDMLRTPWKNLQGVIRLLEVYQHEGMLKKESPLSALGAFLGPIMINQMIRRADHELSVPAIDPEQYVAAFLNGRRP